MRQHRAREYLKGLSLAIALTGAGICTAVGTAQAQTLGDIVQHTKVDGNVRAYYFTRQFTPQATSKKNNVNAFSLAVRLNVTTAPFAGGFGIGATLLTAQSLGHNVSRPDSTLMGPDSQVTALGQLYLQYKQPLYMVRVGDQILNTPWMNASDSRVMPVSFQAALVDITPIEHLHIYGIREIAWKSRTSKNYFKNNLYYPSTWGGDSSYGGQPYTVNNTSQRASGTLAFGASYANMGLKAQAWYYNFYQFARTFYGEAKYTYDTGTGFNPVIGIQAMRQQQSNSMFNQYNVKPNGLGGNVDSTTEGAMIGVKVPHGMLALSYDKVLYRANAFGGGVVISPFTANYATDPLWTTSMIRGLVELGPGHAWKIKGSYKILNDQLKLVAAFTKYTTQFKGNSTNLYFDATYSFHGALKGLSLRDRVEISRGHRTNGADQFVYNRVITQYTF